jgi:hypothetical protein
MRRHRCRMQVGLDGDSPNNCLYRDEEGYDCGNAYEILAPRRAKPRGKYRANGGKPDDSRERAIDEFDVGMPIAFCSGY